MREASNIDALRQLQVDWIGFIFYEKSSRFLESDTYDLGALKQPIKQSGFLGQEIKKVGVFVNADQDDVIEKANTYKLDYIQLHGDENIFYCSQLKKAGLKIIKAFAVDNDFSFTNTYAYQYFCEYFLFDTKGAKPGGNGIPFDWAILKNYEGYTPFFLSGGIHPGMADKIKSLNLKYLAGVDLNSGFEIKPAFKDVQLLSTFINELHSI